MKKIWFDMDGTIADFYGVNGWLADLEAENARPYREAKGLVNLQALARRLNRLIAKGYEINIVSWTSKGGSADFNARVEEAKKAWLAKHLASVKFTNVDIIAYGSPKSADRSGILFDDEEPNRNEWGYNENRYAFEADGLLEVLAMIDSLNL